MDINTYFLKIDIQMIKNKWEISLVTKKILIKTTRHHFTSSRMSIMKRNKDGIRWISSPQHLLLSGINLVGTVDWLAVFT